jgi:hypothetical protein
MTLRSLSVGAGLLVAAALRSLAADAQGFLPAFPGAEGFGADTTGGRGGRAVASPPLVEELRHRLDPSNPADTDGCINLEEFLNATDPTVAVDYTVRG